MTPYDVLHPCATPLDALIVLAFGPAVAAQLIAVDCGGVAHDDAASAPFHEAEAQVVAGDSALSDHGVAAADGGLAGDDLVAAFEVEAEVAAAVGGVVDYAVPLA